jgi:hypothetical protein
MAGNPTLVPFSQLMLTMKSGDIILMHGEFTDSWLIEAFEHSMWTHSGMVIKAEDIGLSGKAPDYLFWESNSLNNLTDVLLNTTKTGPMLVSLADRVIGNAKNYKEVEMTYIKLNYTFSAQDFSNYLNFIPTIHAATFPSDLKMMLDEILGRYLRIKTSYSEVFCSELVAATYNAFGILGTNIPFNGYEPGDYARQDGYVKFLNNASLTPPVNFDPLT